jgi:hypothetical protein
MHYELERVFEAVLAPSKVLSSFICLEGLRKTTKSLNQDSRSPQQLRTEEFLNLKAG